VLGFTFFDVANICVYMILYDFCLLPATFCYVVINIQHVESHVPLVGQCVPWKFANGAENLVLQVLQLIVLEF
jgi:hypothetical protein